MMLRRYYPKGHKGPTYSDEYLIYLESQGVNVAAIDNAQFEVILTKKEQRIWYDECIYKILHNTREVLDNLEHMPEFKVNWQFYGKNRKKPKPL